MTVKDININEDFGLEIKDGDFKIDESDKNHIQLIISTYLGSWKEFPSVGCGIDYYLASSGQDTILKRNIKVQLEADNYRVLSIGLTRQNENIIIDPKVERLK